MWKDTVMNENEIADVLLGIPVSNTDVDIKHRREAIQKVVQAQAEITWGKAVREVVEWLKTCELSRCCDGTTDEVYCRNYRVYDGDWQAKLKEWGL